MSGPGQISAESHGLQFPQGAILRDVLVDDPLHLLCTFSEILFVEHALHGFTDLLRFRRRTQPKADAVRCDARCIVVLVAAHREADKRETMSERPHHGPMTGVGYDGVSLRKDFRVRGRFDDEDVLRDLKVFRRHRRS